MLSPFLSLKTAIILASIHSRPMGGSALGVASEGVASSTGSNAYMIYIPVGVFFVLCPLIVGIRLWARRRTSGRLDIDDFFILAALVRATDPLDKYQDIATCAVVGGGC